MVREMRAVLPLLGAALTAVCLYFIVTRGLGLSSQSIFTGSLAGAGLLGAGCLAGMLRGRR
jgi:hypothetical protein